MEGRPEHTVEYRSIDYYSMCEKSKAKIKAMQDAASYDYDLKLPLKKLRIKWVGIPSL